MGSTWFWLAVAGTASVAVAQGALLKHAAGRITAQYALLLQQDANVASLENGAPKGGVERDVKPQYSATLADLAILTRPDWPIMAVAFTALLIAAGAQVLIPHYTGTMVAAVVDRGREADFRPAAVRLVGAAIVCAIFTGVRGGLFTLVGSRVNVRIRQMLFDSLVRQEIGFFDTTKTGEITSRLSADCTKVGDQVCLNINLFLRNFVQAAGTLLFMFYLSWRLSTVAFVSVPAIVGVSRYYGHFIRDLAKQVQERLAEANAVAEEALGSMTTVRSFAAEGRESAAYGARLHDYYALAIREAAAYGAYASTAALLPQLVTVLVLFYGGRMVLAGQLDGGSVVAFMLYLSSLSDGFNNMGAIFSSITQAVGAADKVFELIRREPQVRKPRGGAALRPLECAGELTLEEVHFTYPARPTRPVLHGVNLVVRPGQVLALVGPSGGGKSSCVSLIENFYHPDQGRLLLDGTPVQDLDHRWYHRVVSLVGQEPVLYGRTIEQNILYGLEGDADEPTHADVVAAARLANAHAFIDALPHGYDTQVGQRGVQMSGGEAAAAAAAAALNASAHSAAAAVCELQVLLLDEATSALDAESEFLVQEAINKMMHTGMTVVIIAHRLSTIKSADVIAVVRAGRVVEQGSHAALLAAGGVYAGLVSRQLGDVIE
ncbi:ABC transporter type 1, transmembrane domain-containing protein [Tribonema minus]|uniref:ABC transporter type 1, transmembrane domain-containing protein n=1 Tax=Tribonema minus TaxID=303371 RepID=A0A835YSY9_9STRA|nr:ABC transporter type 1, transmembrane domain-containing protein [Tribonema minus]